MSRQSRENEIIGSLERSKRQLRGVLARFRGGRMLLRQLDRRLQIRSGNKPPAPAETFIISYPGSGRTWLRLLIGKAMALHHGIDETDLFSLTSLQNAHPHLPSILASHDDAPFRKKPWGLEVSKYEYQDRRVILMARDPRDIAVSYFFKTHKGKRKSSYRGDLSSFVREEQGSLATIIQYYNIWAENRHIPRGFLIVRYEDLHVNTGAELRRVLDFLGMISVDDATISEAVDFARFDNMRRMEATSPSDVLRGRKMRRGEAGGFLDYFSDSDLEFTKRSMAKLNELYGYQ